MPRFGDCNNFLYVFKGVPPARDGRARRPRRTQGREVIEHGCVIETGTSARTKSGKRWDTARPPGRRAMPRPLGWEPCGARRRRQVRWPASAGRRCPPLRSADDRTCEDRAWAVLRAGHPLAARRSQSRALRLKPPRRSRDGASATLDSDLPRQDLGTYRMDGADRRPAGESVVQPACSIERQTAVLNGPERASTVTAR